MLKGDRPNIHLLKFVRCDRPSNRPNQLSGGQQQRVAIVLVNQPALFLADKLTSGLDSQTSQEVMNLFSLLSSQDIMIAVVTYEPDVAAHTNRKIFVQDGLIVG